MTGGNPSNAPLRVGKDVREPLGRDAEHPHRLGRRVREVVQAVWAFGGGDDVSRRELLLPPRRSRQKLDQRRAEHVGAEWVPEPADAPNVVLYLIPGFVSQEVQASHRFLLRRLSEEIMLALAWCHAAIPPAYLPRVCTETSASR